MNSVVKSAGRVLEIFEFFAHRHAPATVSEVAQALGIPLSSTSVLLRSLLTLGYLEYAPRSREYQPTLRFAALGTWVLEQMFAEEEGVPRAMDALHAETGETIVLAVQSGAAVDYVRILQSTSPVRFVLKPGSRRPIWLPAAGKALLAQYDDQAAGALLRHTRMEPGGQVPDPAAVLAELARIRRDGYALSEAAVVPDTAMLAVAVPAAVGQGRLALAVSGPLERMRRNRERYVDLLRTRVTALRPRSGDGS